MRTKNEGILFVLSLVSFSIFSALILSSSFVSADDDTNVVDEINITVPVSCSMSGVGMNTHNATINNGSYNSAIGETTINAVCNDTEGFAIYAIGYTEDTDGKNVLTNQALGSTHDIVTGTNTSGDTSNWAMKLTKVTTPTPTYPIIIAGSTDDTERQSGDLDYSSFQPVPSDYTLVAKRTSGTDVGVSAEGSNLKTTYQAYINKAQPAGTYSGQVKYVLVHPSTAPEPVGENQIGVIYDGNGLFFDQAGTKSTNRVVYEESCEDEYGYIGNTPAILKTRNLNNDGTQNGPYSQENGTWYEGDGLDPNYIEFEGASKIKVVARYGLTQWTGYISLNFDSVSIDEECGELCDNSINRSGTVTYIKNASEFSVYSELGGSSTETGYDYGLYIEAYPVYAEPTEGTTYGFVQNTCSYQPVSGAFSSVASGGVGIWYSRELNETFYERNDGTDSFVVNYLDSNSQSLKGKTIKLYASNKYTIRFDANGGSGTMPNREIYQNVGDSILLDDITLTKPHQDVVAFSTNADGTGEVFITNDYDSGTRVSLDDAEAGDTIVLYAQWGDCLAGRICFEDNGVNYFTTTKRQRYSSYSNLERLSFPHLANHGFAGWNTKADGTGNNYGPDQSMQELAVGNTMNREGIRLYAKWVPSSGNLQNWAGCNTINIGDVIALTDQRDNNTYAVAKLDDDNCWMIENLRLENTALNNSDGTLAQAYSPGFAGLPAPEAAWGNTSTTANSLYSINGSTDVTISGVNPAFRFPRYGNTYANSYGNRYTWAAATASIGNRTDMERSYTSSICPKGWRIPDSGSSSGSYSYLASRVNSVNNPSYRVLKRYPYNFSAIEYWTNMSYSSDKAYRYAISTNNSNESAVLKSSSIYIRCLKQ